MSNKERRNPATNNKAAPEPNNKNSKSNNPFTGIIAGIGVLIIVFLAWHFIISNSAKEKPPPEDSIPASTFTLNSSAYFAYKQCLEVIIPPEDKAHSEVDANLNQHYTIRTINEYIDNTDRLVASLSDQYFSKREAERMHDSIRVTIVRIEQLLSQLEIEIGECQFPNLISRNEI